MICMQKEKNMNLKKGIWFFVFICCITLLFLPGCTQSNREYIIKAAEYSVVEVYVDGSGADISPATDQTNSPDIKPELDISGGSAEIEDVIP